ncbi:MAG: AraC family transcriptional regulator [Hyphomonadaceae bacterium]|nr:AraC family transcriptional regulator [Clostridia bacterium]
MRVYLEGTWGKENTPSALSKSTFYYIQSMGHFYCGEHYAVERKDYNTFLLAYTIKGEGVLKYAGQCYTLAEGTVFLIDCTQEHFYATNGKENSWEFIYIHFNGSESRSYVKQIHLNEGPVYTVQQNSVIPKTIQKIHALYNGWAVTADIQCACAIMELLTELLLISNYKQHQNNHCSDIIVKAIGFIESHFEQTMTIDDISHALGMSKYHFARMFKKQTGYSPHEYLIVTRLNYTKVLLKTTDETISEIAIKTGFDSASHFIKIFKQKEGITPLKFRNCWQ